jgi:hypothetical protein
MVQVGELRERCVVVTSEVTEMRKGGKHYPYVVVSGKAQHSFSLDHRDSIESFLFIVAELFQCSRLEGSEVIFLLKLLIICVLNRQSCCKASRGDCSQTSGCCQAIQLDEFGGFERRAASSANVLPNQTLYRPAMPTRCDNQATLFATRFEKR